MPGPGRALMQTSDQGGAALPVRGVPEASSATRIDTDRSRRPGEGVVADSDATGTRSGYGGLGIQSTRLVSTAAPLSPHALSFSLPLSAPPSLPSLTHSFTRILTLSVSPSLCLLSLCSLSLPLSPYSLIYSLTLPLSLTLSLSFSLSLSLSPLR